MKNKILNLATWLTQFNREFRFTIGFPVPKRLLFQAFRKYPNGFTFKERGNEWMITDIDTCKFPKIVYEVKKVGIEREWLNTFSERAIDRFILNKDLLT